MSSDVCGNCGIFSPASGQRLFNCIEAGHAGLGYGMQVRADTRACDRFLVFASSPPPAVAEPQPERPESAEQGLCTLGQKSLVLAVGFSILMVTWILYTCATA